MDREGRARLPVHRMTDMVRVKKVRASIRYPINPAANSPRRLFIYSALNGTRRFLRLLNSIVHGCRNASYDRWMDVEVVGSCGKRSHEHPNLVERQTQCPTPSGSYDPKLQPIPL